ncbi:hypothetical protein EDF64_101238 [Curtobacterium flaccumfaciens]|uniref:Uncharacterized protein n=1 Tax=Curtobacterium flaccumfaciens TaxID=2035 RepID=A0A4R6DN34_9MICO|nr:hypothetical protein [Curtobacterium flaccumfaciens]TDN46375.1 hypothetical protein EDF64_101238 [Curtobacterium flaccumfaciens]
MHIPHAIAAGALVLGLSGAGLASGPAADAAPRSAPEATATASTSAASAFPATEVLRVQRLGPEAIRIQVSSSPFAVVDVTLSDGSTRGLSKVSNQVYGGILPVRTGEEIVVRAANPANGTSAPDLRYVVTD